MGMGGGPGRKLLYLGALGDCDPLQQRAAGRSGCHRVSGENRALPSRYLETMGTLHTRAQVWLPACCMITGHRTPG